MRRGFTLIEILITILIFGILVSITGYVYESSLTRSADSQRKNDLLTIKNALNQYYVDNHAFPRNDNQAIYTAKYQLEANPAPRLGACVKGNSEFLTPKYLTTVPQDTRQLINLNSGCTALSSTQNKQYLYLSFPKASATTGFYLFARVERPSNDTAVPATLATDLTGYDLSPLNDCVAGSCYILSSRDN